MYAKGILPICYICLRSYPKLRTLDDHLEDFYDELCDFLRENRVQFCSICCTKLKKFYEFKKQCELSSKTLKTWRKQKACEKPLINQLYTRIPGIKSQLSLCTRNNFKAYFCSSSDVDSTSPIQTYTSHPNILSVNIPRDGDTETTENEPPLLDAVVIKRESHLQIKVEDADVGFELCTIDNVNSNNQLDNEYLSDSDKSQNEIKNEIKNNKGKEKEGKLTKNDDQNDSDINNDSDSDSDISEHEVIKIERNKGKAKESKRNPCKNHAVQHDSDVNNDSDSDNDISLNEMIKTEANKDKVIKRKLVKIDALQNESNIKHDSDSDISLSELIKTEPNKSKVKRRKAAKNDDNLNDKKRESDSDISLNKMYEAIKSEPNKTKGKKKKTMQSFTREGLKRQLKRKFEIHGVVKDHKGNIIDVDVILNSIDKVAHVNRLKHLSSLIAAPGPLKPVAIQKLSKLHDHFAEYDSVFTTEYLHDEAKIKAEFERRRECSNYVRLSHKCDKCLRGFVNEKLLDHHIRTQHDESLQFVCSLCHIRFSEKANCMRHVSHHSMVYHCKLCPDFVTSNRSSMIAHYDNHRGVKYACEHGCGMEFKHKATLYVHYQEKCPNIPKSRHICELCARPFVKEFGLNVHKNLKHKGEEFVQSSDNVKCEECDIIFITNDVYDKHMNITHKDHNRKKGPQFICRVCKDEGTNSLWLKKHFAKEHPTENMSQYYTKRKYLCDLCGKVFSNITIYKDHLNTHASLRPYACSVCPKRFAKKTSLKIHEQTHNPPTRECKHCGKMMATASGLHRHYRSHIGERRYVCEICGKGFNHSDSLKAHVNGVHYNIRPVRKRRRPVPAE